MRAVFFCNEVFGLGHLRRSVALAGALTEREDHATALVVTGSPAYSAAELPPRVEVLKLPSPPNDGRTGWSATALRPTAGLALDGDHIRAIRSSLCLTAVRELAPDIVVVDNHPLGRGGDLLAALKWCGNETERLIALGLRDIDDDPERLQREWSAPRMRAVRGMYDLALVYGRHSDDDVRIKALSAAGVPVHSTDLVAAPVAAAGPRDLEEGYVLVTTGGGVDGFDLHNAVLEAIQRRPSLDVPVVIVTGPMMAEDQVAHLIERARELDRTRVFAYRSDMAAVLAGARAVVAMAGYCTVAEILGSGKPAILVPRSFPRREQVNRARRWAAEGRMTLLEPGELEPALLGEALARLIAQPSTVAHQPTGADDAVTILLEATRERGHINTRRNRTKPSLLA